MKKRWVTVSGVLVVGIAVGVAGTMLTYGRWFAGMMHQQEMGRVQYQFAVLKSLDSGKDYRTDILLPSLVADMGNLQRNSSGRPDTQALLASVRSYCQANGITLPSEPVKNRL